MEQQIQPQGSPEKIYPPEEYQAFAQLFMDLDPRVAEDLNEQSIVEAYNKIKEAAPAITMEQLGRIVPQMAQQMQAKMGDVKQEGQQDAKLAALGSVQETME